MGERVRYDGEHKKNATLLQELGPLVEFKSFCPEVSIGLGVPRTPILLLRKKNGDIRCVNADDNSKDYTEELEKCCDQQRSWQETLCGYVFKKNSPSCGIAKVKVSDGNKVAYEGSGVYARKLMEDFPYLPVEEEEGLADESLRENFLQRVFALYRWKKLNEAGVTVSSIENFHGSHSLLIMAHSKENYQGLGNLIATAVNENLESIAEKYLLDFMATLKQPVKRENHDSQD